jgi:hypothetical protein
MPYVVQNPQMFTAAFAGALAGMGVSGRVPTDPNPTDYSGLVSVANAFAEQFDTLWGATAVATLEVETTELACEALWQDRAPQPNSVTLNPTTYVEECAAIQAIVLEALAFYTAQGYTNPPLSGGGGSVVPLTGMTFVDVGTTIPVLQQDGSVAKPYATLQQAFNAGKFNIYYINPFAASAETPTVPPGTSLLSIVSNTLTELAGLSIPANTYCFFENLLVLSGFVAGASVQAIVINGNIGGTFGDNCQITLNGGDIVAGTTFGNNCIIRTNGNVGSLTVGTGCFINVDGAGAVNFTVQTDYPAISDLTAGAGSVLVVSNAVLSTDANISLAGSTLELSGSTSRANVVATGCSLEQTSVELGSITADVFELQDVTTASGVTYNVPNSAGAFALDGVSKYWIEFNGATISHPAALLITDTPAYSAIVPLAVPAIGALGTANVSYTVPGAATDRGVILNALFGTDVIIAAVKCIGPNAVTVQYKSMSGTPGEAVSGVFKVLN